jgi:(p)ppGpp synthase/HD superfamily hydrolase
MSLVERAIIFAATAHEGQKRKSTNIPYITHPFAVGMILQKAKCTDEVIAAGILHDTIEDTPVTYVELEEEFGEHVAKLVHAASEQDKSLSWEERKQQTIKKLKTANIQELQVITADKLHNLRSIREDLELNGELIWERFNRGRKHQHWYYASIVNELSPWREQWPLIKELEEEVVRVFGSLELF